MNPRLYTIWTVVAGLLVIVVPSHAVVLANDDADFDPPYKTDATFKPGQNGGFGFTPWVLLDTGIASSHGGRYLVSPGIDGAYSWGMDGTYTMGRGLATPLTAGTWTVLAAHTVHAPANSGFTGFSLKTVSSPNNFPLSDGEILRFGFNRKVESRANGICVSIDRGKTYQFLNCGWTDGAGDQLEYSVTWDGLGYFRLEVENRTESVTSSFSRTMPAGAVAMLAVANYGAYTDEKLTFDAFVVVPEPKTTLPLIAALALVVSMRRR